MPMEDAQNIDALLSNCRELFNSEVNICLDFIRHLQVDGLKSAYREKVKQCHPDKARALGVSSDILKRTFVRISNAYETVLPYVTGEKDINRLITQQKKPSLRHDADQRQGQEQSVKKRDLWHTGSMPRKKLRLGTFLYYKRLISWQTLQEAIAWQRSHRPLIGQLALNYNFISVNDLNTIFLNVAPGESLCAVAKRLGKLTDHQIQTLLNKQASYNFRIGRFFIEMGLFSEREIAALLGSCTGHNRSVI
ncbi:MAG: hypothetical protein A2324_00200 [Candidatus Raymondbacteria bacterium RIFOXYB2_FULL_49_35]|nr:MAG: hypothetical protein A2324_00200 [Candidatus Raymondbacteria bacterium RIFOXYB2_FULL_49_35]